MGETDVVRGDLSTKDVERLFLGAIDQGLPAAEAREFEAKLQEDPELTLRFDEYQRAVSLLKKSEREKAPDALASMILRRTRRRRHHERVRQVHESRFPIEVVVPLLIAALVALFMIVSAQ